MPRPLPVLFVHSATRPPLGAETWMHALMMRSLDRESFEVHAACAGTPAAPTPTFTALSAIPRLHLRRIDFGPELFRLPPLEKAIAGLRTTVALRSLADLALYVKRRGIRILHTSDRPRDAFACTILARLTGAKCVVHVHVAYGDWMSPMLRRALRNADALAGVSDFVARSLVRGGYDPGKIHAVPNAIDVAAWNPDLDGSGVRRELGLQPEAPVAACVARIFRAKGQAALLRALAVVRKELPDVRLLIVGEDYPQGTHHSDELRLLARNLGISENVVFTGQRRDVAAILAACDVFTMASAEEPFGLVYAEAMAMKRPVVALSDGGTPEVVEHEVTGLLSTAGDIDQLAAHLLLLLRDPSLRRKMGEAGRRRVVTHFTPERLAGDLAGLYGAVL